MLFELFSCQLDLCFFIPVACGLLRKVVLLRRVLCKLSAELVQVLFVALGLKVIPLVGGFGFLDSSIVFEQSGFGLSGSRHAGEDRADCRQHSGHDRQLAGHASGFVFTGFIKPVFMHAAH